MSGETEGLRKTMQGLEGHCKTWTFILIEKRSYWKVLNRKVRHLIFKFYFKQLS